MTKDVPQLFLRLFVTLCISVLLLLTFRLFVFSYYWLDDFNNLFLIQKETVWSLLWNVVNPVSASFRPVGMLLYWIHWHLFDLTVLPYHLFQWIVHCLNVALIYLLLRDIVESDYAAAFGSILFTFQAAYWEVFWSFWAIFELLSGLLFFLALRIGLRRGDSSKGIILASAFYILAIKTKEMAITFPVVWLLYELVVRETAKIAVPPWNKVRLQGILAQLRSLGKKLLVPSVAALWFTYLKVSSIAGMAVSVPVTPSFPYYISFSLNTFLTGYAWYFDVIFHTQLGWMGWTAILVVVIGMLTYIRARAALFFIGYVFVSFLPVVVLPNHRYAYYWYIPFLGVAGLAALLAKQVVQWATRQMPPRLAFIVGGLVFALASTGHFVIQRKLTYFPRLWAAEVATEYRSFMLGLRTLPPPKMNETVYYISIPRFFDGVSITAATQVAFRRPDLQAKIVSKFPPEASYRIRFEKNSVVFDPGSSTHTAP